MIGTVFLNGRFIPETEAQVSVFDRGWMYGDGLFETLRMANGKPFQWVPHWDRLHRGLEFLRLPSPYDSAELHRAAEQLSRLNEIPDGALRISVSRGIGPRGYSPRGANTPTWVMSLGPLPARASSVASGVPLQWRAVTSRQIRVHAGVLAAMKTANRLPQVLARREADEAGVDEALVCDLDGNLAEASSGNVFWVKDGELLTPPVSLGGLPGIARVTLCEIAGSMGVPVREIVLRPPRLREMDAVMLSMSTYGVVEVIELDGHPLKRHALTQRLWQAWESMVTTETQPTG